MAGAPASLDKERKLPDVGDVFADKYRVVRCLGRGGMGIVFAAEHLTLKQTVAIKVIVSEHVGNEDAIARLQREAQVLAKMKSHHVTSVIDLGVDDDDHPFVVMQYHEGEDLRVRLDRDTRADIPQAVDWAIETIEALAHAHALGVVHRDIKPSNLFLTRTTTGTTLKVLDFGISKLLPGLGDSQVHLTTTNGLLGSPLYMSPEQIESSKDVDERADIWSMGVLLYEMLTGTTPFHADSVGGVLSRVLGAAFRPARELRPEIPTALDAAISKCLQRDPDHRFRHVGELAQAIAPLGSGKRQADLASIDVLSSELEARSPATQRAPSPSELGVGPTGTLAVGSGSGSGSGRITRPEGPYTPQSFPTPGSGSAGRAAVARTIDDPSAPMPRRSGKVVAFVGVAAVLAAIGTAGIVMSRRTTPTNVTPAAPSAPSAAVTTTSPPSAAPTASATPSATISAIATTTAPPPKPKFTGKKPSNPAPGEDTTISRQRD